MDMEELIHGDTQGSQAKQENILVSVRLRPLNEREISRNDISDWECINNNTIIFKHSVPERSMFPAAYTLDKVFGCNCPTKQVYLEATKEVALSVVGGINACIFAYGQTSSGKTYTMLGVTEYAVEDIYDYIERHKDREFVLKVSAMEIYNEVVRDLLSSDSTPLRLLDDPERGTVVEKLIEETLRDSDHFRELLSICAAQRQIGETSLNETSSRSHQILRLTVESSSREYLGAKNSSTLAASLNFVDLAGSERASQAMSTGARLKEGCHINRSLLTLGTVIRKLSKGRNEHIPYRDSKLTRILQTSLGGNARTAIICTMSPARSHVEQSRNTLSFAICAKEVTTNAQVNVVMSDKTLVKQLQSELARLNKELRSLGSTSKPKSDSAALLREKEILIEQMDKEIKELIWQRDLALSRVEDLLRAVREEPVSRVDEYSTVESQDRVCPLSLKASLQPCNISNEVDGPSVLSPNCQYLEVSENPEDNFLLDDSTPKFVGPDLCQGWEEMTQRERELSEDTCKEVRCIKIEESRMNRRTEADLSLPAPAEEEKHLSVKRTMNVLSSDKEENEVSSMKSDTTYEALQKKIEKLQKAINYLVSFYPLQQSPCSSELSVPRFRRMNLSRSRSSQAVLMSIPSSHWSEKLERNENIPSARFEKDMMEREGGVDRLLSELNCGVETGNLSTKDSQNSISLAESLGIKGYGAKSRMSRKDSQSSITSVESQSITGNDVYDFPTTHDFTAQQNEMPEIQSEKQFDGDMEAAPPTIKSQSRSTNADQDAKPLATQTCSDWRPEFERQRKEILELWVACNVPLVHRTCFFLLFKGDSSDLVYMEVELRRLSFLKDTFFHRTKAMKGGQIVTPTSSMKDLNRERQMLSKQLQKKFSRKEREGLYQKWGIGLKTRQRSLQLAHRLWTDIKDLNHIKESASLVSQLVGVVEPGQVPKELFGLSFVPRSMKKRSYSLKSNLSLLL
ncbi:kinesin-like protein KIN-7E isoform X2 [Tripterygium wilfordii]|uniref:kinesin-like protein KIN-7E isoform X2 n=1 Tax=Tripterygium wilfordii TaxID=458696 RepID=UPI0018F846E3|nr:kinesin-like protein KIN-7E isoform X2 [Tripterygium wilfordii]